MLSLKMAVVIERLFGRQETKTVGDRDDIWIWRLNDASQKISDNIRRHINGLFIQRQNYNSVSPKY